MRPQGCLPEVHAGTPNHSRHDTAYTLILCSYWPEQPH